MMIPRAAMRRTAKLINQSSRVIRRRTQAGPSQKVQRRAYSSGAAHGNTQASSDLPWAIGSVVVTVPTVTYILWPKPKDNHGHGHGAHEDHGESHGHAQKDGSESEDGQTEDGDAVIEVVEGEDAQDENKDGVEAGDGHAKGDESSEGLAGGEDDGAVDGSGAGDDSGTAEEDSQSDDGSSSEQGEETGTPESSDDDEPATVTDVDDAMEGHKEPQFKGPSKDGPPSDYRTSYPDSKGYKKKRIQSNYAKPLGPAEGKDAVDYDSDYITDKAAAAKPAGSQTTMSGKQQGISNTDTKHSTDLLTDPTKPKKAEGQVESAKLKGTVDPRRGVD